MTPMDTHSDPFSVPMIFLRVGWMDNYQGITDRDAIAGGGAYVAEHGFGSEIFNYKPFQNMMYGYAQPHSRRGEWQRATIDLNRIGATANEDSLPGVLAVWIATAPWGGAFVVGWYSNATVYKMWQPPPPGSGRQYRGSDCGYYVTASARDAVLLPHDERVFSIPQKGKGAFGQSNIWYADDPVMHRDLRLRVLHYIGSRKLPPAPASKSSAPRQSDLLLRQRVERIAIETTAEHFTNLGYSVESVEKDNVGWDLSATLEKRHLKLEVKGLSGSQVIVELTPNEYAMMGKHQKSYRVCVVTNALTTPKLEVFAFSRDSGQWESPERRVLTVREIIAARCSAVSDSPRPESG